MQIKGFVIHRSRQFNNPLERFKNERISVTLEAEHSPGAEDGAGGLDLPVAKLLDITETILDQEEDRLRAEWANQMKAETAARAERQRLVGAAREAIKQLQGREDWDADQVRGEIDLDGDDIPF